MIIRRAQLSKIENQLQDKFQKNLVDLLREEFPVRSAKMTDEKICRDFEPVVKRCADMYDVTETDAVTKFVYLSWLLGNDFDTIPQHAWLHDILLHPRPGSERMEIIMSGVIHHLDQTDLLRVIENNDAG